MTVQFALESVSSLPWNHCPVCSGIRVQFGVEYATNRDHVSDKLAFLNQAAAIFWANKTREERSKHPKNADVVAWLIQREYSQSLAQKAVSIIRPEWAPTGRKPEE
ncbi:hypothetical protein [Candidatus Accumulibacter sp. ACC005]|jgi:hypothetical protein|uniref:hypothetical protein n=2 Tax=unclassified Candidatus Accumulibacter TaxID=2619054 RepID=UPI0025B7EDB1|nr:hypothetical protein [Candidatus Accumulibacter sp. ACC005]